MDGDIDNAFQQMQNDLKAEQMRQENEAATARLREYIEQHRGCTLGLGIFAELFNQCGKN